MIRGENLRLERAAFDFDWRDAFLFFGNAVMVAIVRADSHWASLPRMQATPEDDHAGVFKISVCRSLFLVYRNAARR